MIGIIAIVSTFSSLRRLLAIGSLFPDLSKKLSYFTAAFVRADARAQGVIKPNKGADEEYDALTATIRRIEQELEHHLRDIEPTFKGKVSKISFAPFSMNLI